VPELGQDRVGDGTGQQDGEDAALVHEDQRLVAVELGLPRDRVHQRARFGTRQQLVLPVDIGDSAGPAAGHRGAQRPGRAPGPPRGVDDQVGRQDHPVDPDAVGAPGPAGQALDVPAPDLESRHGQGRRPQRTLERHPAGPHARGHLPAVGQPEPDRFGAGRPPLP
jgi:hypothetical protein